MGSRVRSILLACLLPACAAIQVLAVTSSTGDYQPAAVAPGSLETVWCTGLTGIQGVLVASGPILPAQLGGVSVYAGGAMNAPILAIADLGGYQQINIQVPWDAAGFNTITVVQGQDRATGNVISTAQWPVFFIDAAGLLVAQHAVDYTPVTPDRPASPGEWIVAYATNLGPVANTPPAGALTPLSPFSPLAPTANPGGGGAPAYSVVVPLPGQTVDYYANGAESNFIGLAPLTVGVYQINFQVPNGTAAGDAIVYMRKDIDCGFFFLAGCGRGFTMTLSLPAKLPVGASATNE